MEGKVRSRERPPVRNSHEKARGDSWTLEHRNAPFVGTSSNNPVINSCLNKKNPEKSK